MGPKASEAFEEAIDFVNKELKFTDLIRFNLVHMYSMFCFEVLKDECKACNLTYRCLDEAIGQSDLIEKSDNKKEIVSTLDWMRETFVTWINNMAWDDENDGFSILIIPEDLKYWFENDIYWKKNDTEDDFDNLD